MEHGEIESLINSLPNDLAEYVSKDNKLFLEERRKWDEEQERKKQEAKQRKNDENSGDVEVWKNLDLINEFLVKRPLLFKVVEERLTYVNTHAKLCVQLSIDIMKGAEKISQQKEVALVFQTAMKEAHGYFDQLAQRSEGETGQHQNIGDVRLKSFIIYLMKNKCDPIYIKLALAEQFSLPGLENESPSLQVSFIFN